MKKAAFLVILFVLVQLSCSLPFIPENQGYIVYQKVDSDAKPTSELVVLDAKGKELRSVDLPEDVKFLARVPGFFNRYAVYQDAEVSNRLFRVDVETGEYQEYADFSLEGESVHLSGYSSRWLLFTGSQGVYLLNSETGKLTTVPVEQNQSAAVGMIYPSVISPDKGALIIYANTGYWLVTLDNPENPRLIGGDDAKKVGTLSFSDDGKQITYCLFEGESSRVIRENLDGSGSEEILSGERFFNIVKVPQHDQLLIVDEDSINLVSLKDGSEETLVDLDDHVRMMLFDPEGKHVSFATSGMNQDTVHWSFIDLKTREVTLLDDLDGLEQGVSLYGMKWSFINTVYSTDVPYEFYSLNLETGKTNHLMKTEMGSSPYYLSLSSDGGEALMYGIDETKMRFWLFQAEEGKATQLSDEDVAGAAMSANGRWVVYCESTSGGDAREYTIMLLDTKTGESKKIASGYSPVWVNP